MHGSRRPYSGSHLSQLALQMTPLQTLGVPSDWHLFCPSKFTHFSETSHLYHDCGGKEDQGLATSYENTLIQETMASAIPNIVLGRLGAVFVGKWGVFSQEGQSLESQLSLMIACAKIATVRKLKYTCHKLDYLESFHYISNSVLDNFWYLQNLSALCRQLAKIHPGLH